MSKILKCLVAILTMLSLFPLTALAEDKSDLRQVDDLIFQGISADFVEVTGLSYDGAAVLYEDLESASTEILIPEISGIELGTATNDDPFVAALYIQDNYEEITKDLSLSEKTELDKYYLALCLEAYGLYGTETLYADNLSIAEAAESTRLLAPAAVNEGILQESISGSDSFSAQAASTAVAELRIFSCASGTGSSSGYFSGHSWITVKNISSGNIVVGKFNIAKNKSLTIGTWGNRTGHVGLWYDLEGYLQGYSGRVSMCVPLDSYWLSVLNTHIVNSDSWGPAIAPVNNCSTFAIKAWNKVCSTTLSAGTINTPTALKQSIVSHPGYYSTNSAIPYDYVVYYAQGTGTPIRSTVYV